MKNQRKIPASGTAQSDDGRLFIRHDVRPEDGLRYTKHERGEQVPVRGGDTLWLRIDGPREGCATITIDTDESSPQRGPEP